MSSVANTSRPPSDNPGLSVTVDGHMVTVPAGTTILAAAEKAGIDVPQLCYLAGYAAPTSCFVCVVHVDGRRDLVPACVTPVVDGMVVRTSTEEVRAARRVALELLLSDHTGECEAPCTLACPASMDIPRMVLAIAGGAGQTAFDTVVARIPLGGSLGRICPRYCERACRRAKADAPVAICALKRHAWGDDAGMAQSLPRVPEPGRPIAVVGAGPAGLSAAWFLRRLGYGVTLFEAASEAGGAFRFALPAFRLPADVVRREVAQVMALGVELRTGWRLDTGEQLEALRQRFAAVVLATGASRVRRLNCAAGGEAVPTALDFLRLIATGARPRVLDAVVVGGGNEAVEAARSLVRLGASPVRVLAATEAGAMPGFAESRAAAVAEGVEIVADCEVLSVVQSRDGKWIVRFRQGTADHTIPAGTVLNAGPREVDTDQLARLGVPTRTGRALVHRGTWQTELPWLFAIGELVTGPGPGIRAVAAGHEAASAVDQWLRGVAVVGLPDPYNHRLGELSPEEEKALAADRLGRPPARPVRMVPEVARQSFTEIESGLTPEAARAEAERCLQCACAKRAACGLRTYATQYGARQSVYRGAKRAFSRDSSHPGVVYESGKCILCGRCLAIVEAAGERPGLSLVGRGFGTRVQVPFGGTLLGALSQATLDRCVEACPTGAFSAAPEPLSARSGRG